MRPSRRMPAAPEPSSFREKAKALREARRAVALVWSSAPRLMVLNFGLAVVISVLPLASLYQLKELLDRVTASALGNASGPFYLYNLFLLAVLALGTSFARSAAALVSELQSLEVADRMKTILHSKSIELDLEFYENTEYHDTLRRAQTEAPFRPVRIVNSFVQVLQTGLSVIALGGFLVVTLHWGFLVVLLLAALPGLWVRARQSKENFELQRQQTSTERTAGYMDAILTTDWFAKELRLFGLGPFFSKRSEELRKRLREERMTLSKRRASREAVTHIFTHAAIYGSLAVIATRAARGAISIGSLAMYYQALQRGHAQMQEFLNGLSNLYENNLFLRNLSDFLDLRAGITDPKKPRLIPSPIREGLVFENVSFSYPGKDSQILQNISFQIRPGEKIALVGENGSGKTTLVKLMCRLYDPTAGRILLDGTDIREFSVVDLRRQFSVIFQDFVRYHLSVAENISLGDIEHAADRNRIIAASKRAGADQLAAKLPNNYDTLLGRVLHEGEEISGGEWQKIALARAFLRESPFIIMDEPTSAMDARAEYAMFKRFAEMAEGRAAFLISHRLSTVRMADTILFLDNGRITERGHHDELVARGGSYSRLFEMQAKNYR
jgi:ATP-binding cassette, subfamily B, bacterial